ncbi:MAG: helix-turn-helix domain-containing protein [Vicinamibacterales bacterium]
MGDFGGTLRSARERKGVSLRHIANATKISMSALEALERNDFDRLPGGIFSRSFVRAYADEVGLDPDQTVADFLKEAGQTFEPPPAIAQEDTPLLPEHADPALEFRQSWKPSRMFGLGPWTAIVLLVGVIVVFLTVRGMDRAAPAAAPPAVAGAPAQPQQAAQPGAGQATAAPNPTGPIPDLNPGQPMRLVLTPSANCWVELTVDGTLRVSRVMAAGERETHDIQEGALLQVGDAAAMTFTINGRASKPIGDSGQVETLRISRTNFKDFIQ